MKKVNAIMIREFGPPAQVVEVEEQELREPGVGEVLVEMRAAPINPVDLNVLEGKYPVLPELPAIPGTEGAGVVGALGKEVRDLHIGQQVILAARGGSWREACIVREEDLIAVPNAIPAEQAAMLKINPPTAWRMLHDFVALQASDWIVQNAANSGVGRAVIQIARELGIKTVNVVRRPELVEELTRIGADVVLMDGEDLRDQIKAATGAAKIALALNAVGGESALRLANALAPGGVIVTYGAMGRQPLRIPNGLLIFKDLRWRGFWITKWFKTTTREARDEMFARLFALAERGVLHTVVERAYSIGEAKNAIAHAQRSRRSGKVIFEVKN